MKFYLYFKTSQFKRGDIITDGKGRLVKVIKTYKRTWWRIFLHDYLKINIYIDGSDHATIKVKLIK